MICNFYFFVLTLIIQLQHNVFNNSLQLVHVIFRHGHRTSLEKISSTKNTFYPNVLGRLTNEGKTASYKLGVFLKERYGKFLGDSYQPELLDAVSAGTERASMTLSLLLTGLFYPRNTLLGGNKNSNWQPTIYRELSLHDKLLLSPFNNNCSTNQQLFKGYFRAKNGKKVLKTYARFYEHIQEKTNTNPHPLQKLVGMFDIILMPREVNYKPFLWNKDIFFQKNGNPIVDFYFSSSESSEFKQLTGGFLLKKILNDTQLKINKMLNPTNRKMFLYSAHDTTVFYILQAMEVPIFNIPDYTACVIVEVHKINNVDSVRILYRDLKSLNIMIVPGCTEFCPLVKFIELVEKNIPSDELCKSNPTCC